MALRDFNWIDIPFGLFVAGLIALFSSTAAMVTLVFILGNEFGEVDWWLFMSVPAAWAVGVVVLAWRYPGPGRIVERPMFAAGAFLALPMIVGAVTAFSVYSGDIGWDTMLLFTLICGFGPSLLFGFVVLFAIHSEAVRRVRPQRVSWPIVRPAGSQGGMHGVLPGEAKVIAGLERGGTEEQRPDTFIRMKTRD